MYRTPTVCLPFALLDFSLTMIVTHQSDRCNSDFWGLKYALRAIYFNLNTILINGRIASIHVYRSNSAASVIILSKITLFDICHKLIFCIFRFLLENN